LLDDPVFFEPFVPFFSPDIGRPSIPIETSLRLIFLRFRYRLGFETLCGEVADSLTWRRFCRIAITDTVPDPSTLMKITTRCGEVTVTALNEKLLEKANAARSIPATRISWLDTAMRYQHATEDRDRILASALADLAPQGDVKSLESAKDAR
jgi:transposase, IS5 family